MTLLLTNVRASLVSAGLGLLLPACGGPAFSTAEDHTDGSPGGAGAAAGAAGSAGLGGAFSDGPDAAGGSGGAITGGAGGSAGIAGSAGTVDGGGGDGGINPNDHPDLLHPTNGKLLTPPRAYLLWQPGALQDASKIIGYQLCYTTAGLSAIDGANECPNSKSIITPYDALDGLAANSTTHWKVRALKDNASVSAYSSIYTFEMNDGLLAFYRFDQDIGNTQQVTDSSGKGNHGVLVSDNADATAPGQGIIGQALMADGENDYVNLTAVINHLSLDANGEYAVEVRSRLELFTGNQTLFGLLDENGGEPALGLSIVDLGQGPRLRARIQDGALLEVNGPDVVLQQFQHSIMTYTGQSIGTLDLFQDGVSAGACPCTSFSFTGADFGVVGIGARLSLSSAIERFKGAIDELAIYKRALDQDDVDNKLHAARILAGEAP